MLTTYIYPKFEYRTPPEIASGKTLKVPVVVVGAGPVGLGAALDLEQQGVPVLLLDEDDTVSIGSRGVCYAKRALEILDRYGVGDAVCSKGVSWNVGRTFFREQEVYNFNLVPEPDHHRPGMVNLQQYYLEEYLAARAASRPNIDLRWRNKIVSVAQTGKTVTLKVETEDGFYSVETDWLIAADGARSPIRRMLGLDIEGKIFMDRFLIADVVMKADFPAERWFWFDPPFHPGQSVLLHKQADSVFRIDFQLGWDADPEEAKKPENVLPRIKAMLGAFDGAVDKPAREFELEWVSVYTFQCRRMGSFNHGRVLFVGDAAHQVSPFGARGANSGLQDADNLGWKLKLVLDGKAPEKLLDSYSEERIFAADENLVNSTRSTDFITPKSKASRTFRNAVLGLAKDHAFGRALVNSGRLSVPAFLTTSSLNTPDCAGDTFAGRMVPGAPMDDAPIIENCDAGWLLNKVGKEFVLLCFVDDPKSLDPAVLAVSSAPSARDTAPGSAGGITFADIPLRTVVVSRKPGTVGGGIPTLEDPRGIAAQRYDAKPGTVYLLRPDQHVAARWRSLDAAKVKAAVARATCNA
ncbi:MAG: 3-(3-hydroxy-phenyl)propionate hydroxylase [Rhodocyclaceae bacterium]|nr:MAG: 3-(3-hydroxy-phenyl)propionate hydroxylase [Rhodocyclaceae bacterium]TND04889.1 MAG: 3-(3-hydroxy-phenyl)propionate hydroxylase [Rhodocyclaceae bacterium]